jgi:protein-L-isoaspartate(D-aspartate) O-methyltransferase
MGDHEPAASNDDLIRNLQRSGTITKDAVAAAFRLVPRDRFVPEEYKDEALVDAPIRIESMEFNVSAPHVQTTMVEALEVFSGAAVLDIGSGSGIVTAALSVLAGKTGSILGIDIRRDACELSKKNVEKLKESSPEYDSCASVCRFECLNAFLLRGTAHVGKYDRIHVGASCPPDHLRPILQLLKPEGGVMVVPVNPSDLRLITVHSNGRTSEKVLSQVRFSELEVPSDAEVVLSAMKAERKTRMSSDTVAPSAYAADVAMIIKESQSQRWKKEGNNSTNGLLSSSPAGIIDGLPQSPYALRSRDTTNREKGAPGASSSSSSPPSSSSSSPPPVRKNLHASLMEALGDYDCYLASSSGKWRLPAHSSLLCQRSDVLHARCNSGMSDVSLSSGVTVPEHFSEKAVSNFLYYVYHDELECTAEEAVETLHVAQYFGVPRCSQLCEHMLAKVLKSAYRSPRAVENASEAAPTLLSLAHNQGLSHLSTVALDFIVTRPDIITKTESFSNLGKEEVMAVAEEACRQLMRATQLLEEMKQNSAGDGGDGDTRMHT